MSISFVGMKDNAMHRIGEEVSGQLEIIPACVQANDTLWIKYSCRQCDEDIKTTPAPQQPITKGLGCGINLIFFSFKKCNYQA